MTSKPRKENPMSCYKHFTKRERKSTGFAEKGAKKFRNSQRTGAVTIKYQSGDPTECRNERGIQCNQSRGAIPGTTETLCETLQVVRAGLCPESQ